MTPDEEHTMHGICNTAREIGRWAAAPPSDDPAADLAALREMLQRLTKQLEPSIVGK